MDKWETVHGMHSNSLVAYYQGLLDDTFSTRERKIIEAFKVLQVASDRGVMNHLGFTDMNAVRPRITELTKQAGLLEECGKIHDEITCKPVRISRIKPQPMGQLRFL